MRRRDLVLGIAGALAAPLAARAQQATPVIGYMSGGSQSFYAGILPAFRDGLRKEGYAEGENVTIEYRWAEGHYDRLPGYAAEFVGRQVDLIVASGGNLAPKAAKAATSAIPIVFTAGADPVADGLVASLSRPGGNLTGVSFLTTQLYPKRLQLLCEAAPQTQSIAMLAYANGPNTASNLAEAAAAAAVLGKKFIPLKVSTEGDFEAAFASLDNEKNIGLAVQTDPFIDFRFDQIVGLAARYRIPTIYGLDQFPRAGGLMSYGVSIAGVYHQAGQYAGKILAGAKPADLPVQQPTKFDFIINLKTARALGLVMPQSLLTLADEVIE